MTLSTISLSLFLFTALSFDEANSTADAGNLEAAISGYEALLKASPHAAGVWFNLGNAALHSKQLERAIAAYRTAEAFVPRDVRIRNNLALARGRVEGGFDPSTSDSVSSSLVNWRFAMSRAELGWLVIATSLLFWTVTLLLPRTLSFSRALRPILGVLLVVFFAWWASRHVAPNRIAVIKRDAATVRTGTDRRADVRFVAPKGMELRWHRIAGGWVRVSQPSGRQGWIPRDDVYLLEL